MPDNPTIEVIKAVGAIITPIALAWIGVIQLRQGKKQEQIHREMNGMKSELVEAVRGEAQAIGEMKGAADNQALTDAKEQNKK